MTAQSTVIQVNEQEGIQTWLLSNAPVNALSPELLDGLEQAIREVQDRQDISVIVLGSTLRVFSAGADATWMAETVGGIGIDGLVDSFNGSMDRFREICLQLKKLPQLVIAAIDGHAIAGGLELAVACDLRFCSDAEKLQISVPEMDLFGAMPSGGGGAQYLARIMGPSAALEFILNAKAITPEQAQRVGLVDRLVPSGEVLATTEQFAKEVAKKAGLIGVSAAKKAIFGGVDLPLSEAIARDREIHWNAMRTGNFKAGVNRFVENFASKG